MLPGFMGNMMMAGGAAAGQTLLQMITAAAQTSGLCLALDPADIASYAGSGNFLDTSGQSNHYAPLTGASGGDPVFSGAAGGLSVNEYWTGDGTAFPLFQETTAQTFAQPYHQNNAVFSFMAVLDFTGIAGAALVFADSAFNTSGIGTYIVGGIDSSPDAYVQISVFKGSSPSALSAFSSFGEFASVVNLSGFNVMGISVNEASSTGGTYFWNGVTETFNPTYTSPSATAAGSAANAVLGNRAGTAGTAGAIKYGPAASWNVALGAAGMNAVYTQMKTRYPSLP